MTNLTANYSSEIGKIKNEEIFILAEKQKLEIIVDGISKIIYTCPVDKKAQININLKGIEVNKNSTEVMF